MVLHIQINKHNAHHKNEIKYKTDMIISIDAEKAFNKIHHHFMIKVLKNLEIERSHLNIIKVMSIPIIIPYGEKFKAFSPKCYSVLYINLGQIYNARESNTKITNSEGRSKISICT
jgi:hypothetical protein